MNEVHKLNTSRMCTYLQLLKWSSMVGFGMRLSQSERQSQYWLIGFTYIIYIGSLHG